MSASSFHIELGSNPVKFDSRDRQVFFDEAGYCVRNTCAFVCFSTPLPLIGAARRIPPPSLMQKSPQIDSFFASKEMKLMSYEFIHLPTRTTFVQACRLTRQPNAILGFFWASASEVFFVTTHGLEYFKVVDTKLKNVNTEKFFVNWFVYSHRFRILFCATGQHSTNFVSYYIHNQQLTKLPKLDVVVPKDMKEKVTLIEKDICVAKIYSKLYCVICVAQTRTMLLYSVTREAITLVHSIPLHTHGSWSVSVVDSLIITHNVETRISMLFDIKHSATLPVGPPLPIAPVDADTPYTQIYSPQWQFLPPNYVMDAQAGYLWEITVNYDHLSVSLMDNLDMLMQFLMRRNGCAPLLLQVVKSTIEEKQSLSTIARLFDIVNDVYAASVKERAHTNVDALKEPGRKVERSRSLAAQTIQAQIADGLTLSPTITAALLNPNPSTPPPHNLLSPRGAEDSDGSDSFRFSPSPVQPHVEGPTTAEEPKRTSDGLTVIDQYDMHNHVFHPLEEDQHHTDPKYMVGVVTEYIRSLVLRHLTVHHFIYEFIIDILVKNNKHYQLHQFLQYHAVNDSVHVACQLLALSKQYPPAAQLALDMLKRLEQHDAIVEILLNRKDMLTALRFVQAHKLSSPHKPLIIACKRFLEAALETGDDTVFYNVYDFLDQWVGAYKKGGSLVTEEGCAPFVQMFQDKFGSQSLSLVQQSARPESKLTAFSVDSELS